MIFVDRDDARLRETAVMVLETLQPGSPLDIGCGEGCHSKAMVEVVCDGGGGAKPAIQATAKQKSRDGQ